MNKNRLPSSQEDGIDHTARQDGAESYREDLGSSCELFREELAEGALEGGSERLGESVEMAIRVSFLSPPAKPIPSAGL